MAAIEKQLLRDGFVQRYTQRHDTDTDGLPPGEGAFLACTFWLADNYSLMGRHRRGEGAVRATAGAAQRRRAALRGVRPAGGQRLVGNFPQAFSHVPLINTARNLSAGGGPSHQRERTTEAGQESAETADAAETAEAASDR